MNKKLYNNITYTQYFKKKNDYSRIQRILNFFWRLKHILWTRLNKIFFFQTWVNDNTLLTLSNPKTTKLPQFNLIFFDKIMKNMKLLNTTQLEKVNIWGILVWYMKSHHCLPLSIRHDDVRSSASQRGQSHF